MLRALETGTFVRLGVHDVAAQTLTCSGCKRTLARRVREQWRFALPVKPDAQRVYQARRRDQVARYLRGEPVPDGQIMPRAQVRMRCAGCAWIIVMQRPDWQVS